MTQETIHPVLSFFFAAIGSILIIITIFSKFGLFLLNTFTKRKITATGKSSLTPLIGVSFIITLTIIANNVFIYGIAIIIIATLITELAFLEKLMALLWNRKDYWQYQELLTISKTPQQPTTEPLKEKKEIEEIEKRLEASTPNTTQEETQDSNWLLLYHCEKVYRLIFGSQIGLLQYLIILGNKGLAKFEIGELYRHNPISSSYSLENYIFFLENNQLIQFNSVNKTYQITFVGSFFLNYLTSNQIPTNKPN